MLAQLWRHARFIRIELILLAALPLLRLLLQAAGAPQWLLDPLSLDLLLLPLAVCLPYKVVRRSFGRYWNLCLLVMLCLAAGYGMTTAVGTWSDPIPAVPLFWLLSSSLYLLFRGLRRTLGGGRYTG